MPETSIPQTKPIRVIYITPGGLAGRGGMGSVARCLVRQFKEQKLPVACTVIDSYGPGPFYKMPFYFLTAAARLKFACAFRRVDVVHIHMSHRGSVHRKLQFMRIANFFRVPVLLHIHGSEFEVFCEQLSPTARAKLVAQLNRAAKIAVLGKHWCGYLTQRLGIDAANVVIVYNGVDVLPTLPGKGDGVSTIVADGAVPSITPSPSICKIVALGVMSKRKGTPELLEALASPQMKNLKWKALLAGNGDVDFYRGEAARLGLTDRVDMPGWIAPTDAKRHLAEADIFTLPSHNEGLPMAILEAMAAGVPVVTTPVGAIADCVVSGENGLLVPPGQAMQLADALARLVTQPEKRMQMGTAAHKCVLKQFNSRIFAAEVARLYFDLYQNGSGRHERKAHA